MRDELNPYQKKLLKWKGEEVEVEFINGDDKIEGTVIDVDVWRNKFLLKTDTSEILLLGGVSMIRKKHNAEEMIWRD